MKLAQSIRARASQQLVAQHTQREMSKKASTSNAKAKVGTNSTGVSGGNNADGIPPITTAKNGDFLISIRVKPGAKFNCVTEISPEAVSLQISSPPVDGEANTEIVKFFSELLKLKKTEIDLKGGKSRQKMIVISSKTVTPSSIMETLKSNLGDKF